MTANYVTKLRMNEPRSTEMNSLHEALARERMREMREDAQRSRVGRELAAARRWRRRELRARAAHQRHALRAEQAAGASAVAAAQ
jgi:hypothetical protein